MKKYSKYELKNILMQSLIYIEIKNEIIIS